MYRHPSGYCFLPVYHAVKSFHWTKVSSNPSTHTLVLQKYLAEWTFTHITIGTVWSLIWDNNFTHESWVVKRVKFSAIIHVHVVGTYSLWNKLTISSVAPRLSGETHLVVATDSGEVQLYNCRLPGNLADFQCSLGSHDDMVLTLTKTADHDRVISGGADGK